MFKYCKPLAFIFLFVCLSARCFAISLTDSIPYDAKLIRGHLPNGLAYYIRPNAMPAHKVELRLVVKAGSVLEDEDQLGLAHFIEHMNFNGTQHFPGNSLTNYIETIGMKFGADINANTSYDRTLYELSVPTEKQENVEKGFLVLEDWAHNTLLTDDEIEKEKGVILEESRLGKNAAQRMRDQYFPELVANGRYATRRPLGKDSIIANVSHEALRRYYRDWYRPDLMAVMVIGDVDSATAVKMITDHFAGLTNPTPERPHFFADMPQRSEMAAIIVTDEEATSSSWYMSYPFERYVKGQTIQYYKEMLTQQLLFEVMRARLRDLFQSGRQIADISFVSLQECRSFYLSTSFPEGNPDGTRKAAINAIKRAADYGFYQSEIERAEKEILSRNQKMYFERDKKQSSAYIAEYVRNFMDNEPIEGPLNEYLLTLQLMPSISNGDMKAMLKQLTANENIYSYITAPKAGKGRLPGEITLLKTISTCLQQPTLPLAEKVVSDKLLKEEPENGTITGRTDDAGLGSVTYTLGNGIKVTLKPTANKDDEIRVLGVKKGGICNYEQEDRINCSFTGIVIPLMGYGSYSPNELNRQMQGKNVTVTATMKPTVDEVDAQCGKRDVEAMFQLMYLKLTGCRKDEVAYDNWKTNYKRYADNIYAKPEAFFADTFNTVLYNDDPRYIGVPDGSDVKKLRVKRALEIYGNEFAHADGFHFLIDGNIDTAQLLPLITKYLGSLPLLGDSLHCYDNGLRPIAGHNKFTVHKGLAKQSYIITRYYGDSVKYSEEVVRNMGALDGILNMRVRSHLREQMSDIYTGGFSGEIYARPYEHYEISLWLPCGAEHVDELLAAADEEIKLIKEKGPSEEDVQKIKAQLKEKHRTNMQSNTYWLTSMRNILFSGHKVDNFVNYPAFVDNMTAADIQATANFLFNGKNQLTGILLPE